MRVTRTDWLDWYVDDDLGESAVFADGQVIVLSALATSLVDLVGDGVDLQHLADGLVERHGGPATDALEATRERVAGAGRRRRAGAV